MECIDIQTPLDALEISYISEQIGPFDWRKVGLYLGISENRLANWDRQYAMNSEQATNQMLFTWHNNQIPKEERRLLVEALIKAKLRNLGEKVRAGECRRSIPQGMQPIPPENLNNHRQGQPPHNPDRPQPLVSHEPPPIPHHIPPANPLPNPHPGVMPPPRQTSHEITEMKLRDVSQALGAEWRTVATYLGFNNSEVQIMQEQYPIVKECIFQMLLHWRNRKGVEATKEKFKKVLKRSQREDLLEMVDEPDD